MRFITIYIFFLVLGGCSAKYIVQSHSPDVLFNQAQAELAASHFDKAISLLRKLDSEYIFNEKAIDAEVLLIWLYYQQNKLDQAEVLATSFLKYYPFNKYTPWVEYISALITYQQMPSRKRNIAKSQEALALFKDFINKYPTLEYTKELTFKMNVIKELLASRVIEIGDYYLRHKVYVGAINRYKEILHVYSDTIFVPEALYRLVSANVAIGLKEEAILYYKLLQYNYKDSKWFNKAKSLIEAFYKNIEY